MKKLLLILLLVPLVSFGQSYQDGFRAGWKKGYCGDRPCSAPVAPNAPLSYGTSYADGFANGVRAGIARRSSSGSNNTSSGNFKKTDYSKMYEYQSGGAKEREMIGNSVDAAMKERRRIRESNSQNNYSNSINNSSKINYKYYNEGVNHGKRKNFEEAVKSFSIYIRQYPNDPDGWLQRGIVKSILYDKKGACFDWKKASDLGSVEAKNKLSLECDSSNLAIVENKNNTKDGNSLFITSKGFLSEEASLFSESVTLTENTRISKLSKLVNEYYYRVRVEDGKYKGKTGYLNKSLIGEKSDEIVAFIDLDTAPIFPGCKNTGESNLFNCFNNKLNEHIRTFFHYPEWNRELGCQAKVNVNFVISNSGDIKNIYIKGEGYPYLSGNESKRRKKKYNEMCKGVANFEQNAKKIINNLPKIKPGISNGNKVNTRYSTTITYRLQ